MVEGEVIGKILEGREWEGTSSKTYTYVKFLIKDLLKTVLQ